MGAIYQNIFLRHPEGGESSPRTSLSQCDSKLLHEAKVDRYLHESKAVSVSLRCCQKRKKRLENYMNSMFSLTLNTIKKFTQVSRHFIWYKMQIKLILISFLILKMAEIS